MTDNANIPSPEEFGMAQIERTGYIRAIRVDDLEPEIKTPDGVEIVYALCDVNGRRMALFDDRDLAFAVARSNEIAAVSVH